MVVYATFPDAQAAKTAARSLLQARLVACANIFADCVSLYHWEGQIEQQAEVVLIAKTDASRAEAAVAHLATVHPYEVPCITCWPVTAGDNSYLQWVSEQVS